MLLTDALFSSSRLHFSEVQKTAVLDWAKYMGARGVPSLYSIKKCQEKSRNFVGDPIEKVVSKSGTIFYLNDIASAISKVRIKIEIKSLRADELNLFTQDYANPITRSCMQDFPIDCNGSMSQVHHASKMLLDLPAEYGPPSVRVNNELYFVNELVQLECGQYFIPQRYFRTPGDSATSKSGAQCDSNVKLGELRALGWPVSQSMVCFKLFWVASRLWLIL